MLDRLWQLLGRESAAPREDVERRARELRGRLEGHLREGRATEALEDAAALVANQRTLGPGAASWSAMATLADVQRRLGHLDEAAATLDEAIEEARGARDGGAVSATHLLILLHHRLDLAEQGGREDELERVAAALCEEGLAADLAFAREKAQVFNEPEHDRFIGQHPDLPVVLHALEVLAHVRQDTAPLDRAVVLAARMGDHATSTRLRAQRDAISRES